MMRSMKLRIHPEVKSALDASQAVVALESTVITHGLPQPQNLELAETLEQTVRDAGAVPATVGVLAGGLVVGLSPEEREYLASGGADKASLWNLAALLAQGKSAGTTVATTLHAAHAAGISVFATGGIGGVHAEAFDESADLFALARYSVITVCAGPKSILDVGATLERLESLGVPVLGYQSDYLAGFHVPLTTRALPNRIESPGEAAQILAVQRELGLRQGILVSNPVSRGLDAELLDDWIYKAYAEAYEEGLKGRDITPFMLAKLNELSGGDTVSVNLLLLEENARLAAKIALTI